MHMVMVCIFAIMNSLPSSSRVPNFNINKILSKKTYVPNLSISRNVAPKVKTEVNVVVKKEESGPSTGKRKPGIFDKKVVAGSETFAAAADTGRSRITIKSRPKTARSPSSTSSVSTKREIIDQNELVNEVFRKPISEKFASQISSALPEDLPVSVPRLRPSISNDLKTPISLMKDLFGVAEDESPFFVLKTPKYLPALLNNSKNFEAGSSDSEVENEMQKCTMHDLPDGRIGTLQFMKSGRLRLVLGDCKFWLHRGVSVSFQEELAFVDTNEEMRTGEIVNIANIKDRMFAVPDCLNILAEADTEE